MERMDVKILIVEDERIIGLDLANSVLRLGFWKAFITTDYISALKIIETEKPHIMILDAFVFGCRRIKGRDINEVTFPIHVWNKYKIPHLYLTSLSLKTLKELGYWTSKPERIILKPYKISELEKALDKICENYEKIKKCKWTRQRISKTEKAHIRKIYQAFNIISKEEIRDINYLNQKYGRI